MAEDAAPEKDEKGRFLPGNSGFGGRPKGSRNKLGEAFLDAMLADFTQHGTKVIEDVRVEKPDQYLKVVASILPKELTVKVNDFDDLTDDQLARQYASIAESLIAAGLGLGAGTAATAGPEQAGELPTLQ